LKVVLDMLKNKDRFVKTEGYCILALIVGALVLSGGIGLSILNPKGISAILAMLGSVLSFVAVVALIFVWLIKEFKGE